MAGNNNIVVPLVVGLSLCGLTGLMLYLYIKKDEDKHTKVHSTHRLTKEMKIPKKLVPALIGRSGSNIKEIQSKSGTHISFRDTDTQNAADGYATDSLLVIKGDMSSIRHAEVLIEESLSQMRTEHNELMTVPGWVAGKIIANRPDIVLVDHSKNTTYIVDVTIPHDENLQKAERDKILKYMDLAHEIKDMWRTPATIVVPIVISTNGLIPKSLHANLCKVGVDGGLKYLMQKTVLLSTCRTLRRGGQNIRDICLTSGAKVKLEDSKDSDVGPASQKQITITGTRQQVTLAQEIINQCIANERKRREEESTRREPRGQYAGSIKVTKNEEEQPSEVDGGGSLLEVFVSAVSSPSRFWLQIVGPQVEKLDKLVDLMTDYYSLSENRDLHKLPDVQVGQLVAAVFRHDGKWYRAKVAEIKPNEFDNRQRVCDVHFIDYGDNEYVALDELFGLRTDMLQLRFQAVECFLAEVAPKDGDKWNPRAVERFEELTQVARWKRLWSRTCTFKDRPSVEGESEADRSKREGSPIPGVKLYDVKDGTDIDIAATLIAEEWAVMMEAQSVTLPPLKPITPGPLSPVLPPPTFGDLKSSRVLGMVVSGGGIDIMSGRDERATSLPHAPSPSRNISPLPSKDTTDEDAMGDKYKSSSLAAGMDASKHMGATSDLSYPKKPQTPGGTIPQTTPTHVNGSHEPHTQNNAFIFAEKKQATPFPEPTLTPHKELLSPIRSAESFSKLQPVHMPDPKDDLKAKMNRVDSHHGNLELLGRSTPPKIPSPHK